MTSYISTELADPKIVAKALIEHSLSSGISGFTLTININGVVQPL